jgi:hypothetical protein
MSTTNVPDIWINTSLKFSWVQTQSTTSGWGWEPVSEHYG